LAAAVLRAEGARRAMVSVSVVGRRRMRSLNRVWLGVEGDTDVIAFRLRGPRGNLAGDVYLSPEIAAKSARRLGISSAAETRRLVVHGVLHITGWDHPEGDGRVKSRMWRRQEQLLARLGRLAR
jgi:probable rRNA maturation factor